MLWLWTHHQQQQRRPAATRGWTVLFGWPGLRACLHAQPHPHHARAAPTTPHTQDANPKEVLLQPNERVEAVRPLWESLPQPSREQMLTLGVQQLHERAVLASELSKQQAGGCLKACGSGEAPSPPHNPQHLLRPSLPAGAHGAHTPAGHSHKRGSARPQAG